MLSGYRLLTGARACWFEMGLMAVGIRTSAPTSLSLRLELRTSTLLILKSIELEEARIQFDFLVVTLYFLDSL